MTTRRLTRKFNDDRHSNKRGAGLDEQHAGDFQVWETSLQNPSFAAFARLCGGHGTKVTTAEKLDEAIKSAFDVKGPALVEIISDRELV